MAYSTTVTLLDTEGGALLLDATATVWMLWTTVGGSAAVHNKQDEGTSQVMLNKDLTLPQTITFPGPTDFSYANRFVGLSLQDTNRLGAGDGWLFRSGEFQTTLPGGAIEIVTGNTTILPAALPGMLPTVPFTADAGTTTVVTALTATLAQGGIDFVATGSTRATGVLIAFTYTGRLVLFPSSDIRDAALEAIGVSIANPSITFAAGAVLSAVEAAILNVLEIFILREFGPRVRTTIQDRLNASIISGVSRSLPGGALPTGVILSIRNVRVTTADITVRGALGAFEGVFSKLPPITVGGSGGRCFIASAVYGEDSTQVAALRAFRETNLRPYALGRWFIRSYERVSPLLARFIAHRPMLRGIVRCVIVDPAAWLVHRRTTRGRR